MDRTYEVELDLPRVRVPDWSLLTDLDKALRPYLPVRTSGRAQVFTAKDVKGSYAASSAEELRGLAQEQREPPHSLAINFTSTDMYGGERSFDVFMSTHAGFG